LEDTLVRAVARDSNLRGLACTARDLVRHACRRQNASPTASVALGRALCGGALLGALLKGDQRVAIKLEGNGPIGKILVEARSDGSVCGYAGNPAADLPPREGRFDVAGLLGHAGLLTVTKDLLVKEPYTGRVQLYTSEIAEDLAFYLTESEQIPSAVGLGVRLGDDLDVLAAGGFLVQALPPADESAVEGVADRIQALPPLADMMGPGQTPEDILTFLFEGIPYDVVGRHALAFRCGCSRERMERAVAALGRDEILALANEMKGVTIRCEFCGESYRFGLHELEHLAGTLH
jgi:molecular chaperone Hsp33